MAQYFSEFASRVSDMPIIQSTEDNENHLMPFDNIVAISSNVENIQEEEILELSNVPILFDVIPATSMRKRTFGSENNNNEAEDRLELKRSRNTIHEDNDPWCEYEESSTTELGWEIANGIAYMNYIVHPRRRLTYSRIYFFGPAGTLETIHKYLNLETDTKEKLGENNKDWLMKQIGRPYVRILKDYLYGLLRLSPKYTETVTKYGFWAMVTISGMTYGTGRAFSPKVAKAQAAKATLAIIMPCMKAMNIWQ